MERERFDSFEPDYLTVIVKIGDEKREVKFFYLDGMTTEEVEEWTAFTEEEKKRGDKGDGLMASFLFNCVCLERLCNGAMTVPEIKKHFTQRTVQTLFKKLTALYEEKKSELPA